MSLFRASRWMASVGAVALLAGAASGISLAAGPSVNGPNNPPPPPNFAPGTLPTPSVESPKIISSELLRDRINRRVQTTTKSKTPVRSTAKLLPAPGLDLLGEVDGEWDVVDGYIVFTYDFTPLSAAFGQLQVLVRGFETVREGMTNRYRVDGWDRTAYWIDFDGVGPSIPHLLPALTVLSGYQASDPDFPEFNASLAVQAACTAISPCTINWSPYLLYKDQNVDYNGWPDQAAEADLLFVADSNGNAVDSLLDVYDIDGNYDYSDVLYDGDELLLSTMGYKLSEPGYIYLIGYMDFETITSNLLIQPHNYVPGVDFNDPNLNADLDAGNRSIKFLLDAQAGTGGTAQYAYGGPFDQGFVWANARAFVSWGTFEELAADGTSKRVLAHPAASKHGTRKPASATTSPADKQP